MKYLATLLMAAAVLCGACLSPARCADAAPAAEPKPIAAVAITSYNDLIGDINYVGSLVQRPNLGAAADGLVSLVTQFKGLAGVDKSRPWGAILQAGGEGEDDIVGYVFVPITDFKEALGLLELFNTVEAEGGVYKVSPTNGDKTVYVKQHGQWACFSDKAKSLAHVALDPLEVLRGLGKNYVVAGRIFLANVPDALREKFLLKLKEGFEKEALNKRDDESDEQFDRRKELIGQAETYVARVASELDQINIGWGLDHKAGNTYFDLDVTAKPDTKTAEDMALAAQAKTNFADFRMADAASLWAIASPISADRQELAASLIDVIRGQAMSQIEKHAPQGKRETAKDIVRNSLDLLTKIVKSGRIDGVMTGLLTPESATGLGAFYVADGELFDKILHGVVKAIEEEHPDVAQFVRLDAETVQGHKVHIISIPIPEDAKNRETVVKLIGEKLEVVIAVGKENVYLAAGGDARDVGEKLKKAAEASAKTGPKPVPPLSICYAAGPIAEVVAEVGKPSERGMAKMAVAELKKTPGKDHVRLTERAIANGVQLRLEVQQGLLQLAGRAVVMRTEGKHAPAKPSSED